MEAWFVIWFALAVVIGLGASSRGRSGFGYFVLSVLLSPLVGAAALLLIAPRPATAGAEPTERGVTSEVSSSGMRVINYGFTAFIVLAVAYIYVTNR